MSLAPKVLQWNAPADVFAAKHPATDLKAWSQLIVAESQEAVLLNQGRMAGPFGPGRHTLETANYPVLAELFAIPFGGKTPFTADVWFVNKAVKLDVRWGTATPMMVKDPTYHIILPVRAFGQFGITVKDTRKFLIKLVGTLPTFDTASVSEYFKGVLLSRIKDVVAKRIVKDKISLLEITAHLSEIGADLQTHLEGEFAEFGLAFVKFTVMSINTPEDDPSVKKLKDAMASRAEMDILGTNYQQMRSFEVMETAAQNEGAGMVAAPAMGVGMGLGLGANMGASFSQMAAQVGPQAPAQTAVPCASCQAPLASGAAFCAKCGTRSGAACPSCGAPLPSGSRFCQKCGTPTRKSCAGCKGELPAGAAFCPGCGVKVA